MFKTIRHGENSLQYAILPQHDEGPSAVGTSSGGSGSSGTARRNRTKERRRRTVSVLIVVLILGCVVVAAAVLVPVILTNNLAHFPSTAKFQTFAVAASSVKQQGGRYNIQGTQYIALVPVKQIQGLQQLDNKFVHEAAPAPQAFAPTTVKTSSTTLMHVSSPPIATSTVRPKVPQQMNGLDRPSQVSVSLTPKSEQKFGSLPSFDSSDASSITSNQDNDNWITKRPSFASVAASEYDRVPSSKHLLLSKLKESSSKVIILCVTIGIFSSIICAVTLLWKRKRHRLLHQPVPTEADKGALLVQVAGDED